MNPSIAIIIPTFNRAQIVCETVSNLYQHLIYDGETEIFVGIDGNDETQSLLTERFPAVRAMTGALKGHGANLNVLIQTATAKGHRLLLQMDDDHHLLKPLDLTPHAQYLMQDQQAGLIRLMGIGGHYLKAHLIQRYWHLEWDSPELYIYSHRPHLKHIRFHEVFGLYPEGLRLGHTEESFCNQVKNIAVLHDVPDILIPLDVQTESGWDHVGRSWQGSGL